MGSCTAGGAYVPAMCDETVIVKNQGTIFLGGPPLVKAATGEEVSAEELGGGDVHTRISGVADHLAENDAHALHDRAPHRREPQPREARDGSTLAAAARTRSTTPKEIYGAIPSDTRKPYDVREVIARVVDGSRLDEFKARYGTTLVTGFAHLLRLSGRHRRQQRHPVLRVGAEGRALHRALRAARHPARCSCRTSPASWSARKYEHEGIAKRRRQDGHRGRVRARAQAHRDHRRQLRRRQLRHVRPRLLAALPVDVAERAHLRDGRRAGGVGARHGASATASRPAAARLVSQEDEEAFKAPIR